MLCNQSINSSRDSLFFRWPTCMLCMYFVVEHSLLHVRNSSCRSFCICWVRGQIRSSVKVWQRKKAPVKRSAWTPNALLILNQQPHFLLPTVGLVKVTPIMDGYAAICKILVQHSSHKINTHFSTQERLRVHVRVPFTLARHWKWASQ